VYSEEEWQRAGLPARWCRYLERRRIRLTRTVIVTVNAMTAVTDNVMTSISIVSFPSLKLAGPVATRAGRQLGTPVSIPQPTAEDR
jgi:hypothetical protein